MLRNALIYEESYLSKYKFMMKEHTENQDEVVADSARSNIDSKSDLGTQQYLQKLEGATQGFGTHEVL